MSRKTNVGVVFSLGSAETEFGETLRVVGDGQALGNWNTSDSLQLTTDERAYPRWSSSVVWIPCRTDRETTIRYKYLRDRRESGGEIEWEDQIEDRSVTLPAPDEASTGTQHSPLTWVIGGLTQHLISVRGPLVWIIGDFGWNSPLTSTPIVLNMTGTPAYRPPSVMSSRGQSSSRGDLCTTPRALISSQSASGSSEAPDTGRRGQWYWAEGKDPPTPPSGQLGEALGYKSPTPSRAHHADAKAYPVPPMRGRAPFTDAMDSSEEAFTYVRDSPEQAFMYGMDSPMEPFKDVTMDSPKVMDSPMEPFKDVMDSPKEPFKDFMDRPEEVPFKDVMDSPKEPFTDVMDSPREPFKDFMDRPEEVPPPPSPFKVMDSPMEYFKDVLDRPEEVPFKDVMDSPKEPFKDAMDSPKEPCTDAVDRPEEVGVLGWLNFSSQPTTGDDYPPSDKLERDDGKPEHDKPPENVKEPPAVFASGYLSPEWGNESSQPGSQSALSQSGLSNPTGDAEIKIQDLNKFFTPSTRQTSSKAAMETPVKMSPGRKSNASNSSLMRMASSSLLPDTPHPSDSKPEQDCVMENSPEVMVREESASSLNNLARGPSEVGSFHPVASPRVMVESPRADSDLQRSRSGSMLLPDLNQMVGRYGHGSLEVAASGEQDGSGCGAAPAPTFEDVYSIIGEEPIGEGSFGLVWSCLRKTMVRGGDDQLRAVKRISKRNLAQRDVRNLFGDDGVEGEIRMHFRLKHRHIVAMHEVFDDSSTVSLVMEVCRGGDLFDMITDYADKHDSGLPEVATARVLRHLLRALKFLHDLHIVHRDVKCENVLLLEKGQDIKVGTYKLCDFGFAAEEKEETGRKLKSRLGSPDTVAPEVIKGEQYSTPVDCWAAGVLLFMALSATPPFWANSDVGVLQRVRAGQYQFSHARWTRISDEAKDLVRMLLEYQPSNRASATQLLELPWVNGRG